MENGRYKNYLLLHGYELRRKVGKMWTNNIGEKKEEQRRTN